MKKIILTALFFTFLILNGFSQIGERWDAWAENFSIKAECFAEKLSRDVERNAEGISKAAEGFAQDLEAKFYRGDYGLNTKGWANETWNQASNNVGYLGIHFEQISRKKAEKLGFQNRYGSYVSKVVKNSAAEKAGLQHFDYIYGVEDQRTSDNQDLSDILSDYDAGTEVILHFIRNGQLKTVKVTLEEYDEYDWDYNQNDRAFLGLRPTEDERQEDLDGVSVEIIKGTTADEMGLKKGDIIKAINGFPVLDWDDVSRVLNNSQPGDEVFIILQRDNAEISLTGVLRSKEEDFDFLEAGNEIGSWNWTWDDSGKTAWSSEGAFLGVYIEKISEKKAKALGFDNPYGSYVSGVLKNTAAEKGGLMPFDYIFGIDEYRVGVDQQLGGILLRYKSGDEAIVHF